MNAQQHPIPFTKRQLLVKAQKQLRQLQRLDHHPNFGSPVEQIPLPSGSGTHHGEFVSDVDVEVVVDDVVNSTHHHFAHWVAHLGEFAISE